MNFSSCRMFFHCFFVVAAGISICSCGSTSQMEIADYFSAKTEFEAGNFDASLKILVKEVPGFPAREMLRGKALFFSGKTAKAKTVFRKLWETGSDDAGCWYARLLRQEENLPEAKRIVTELLRRDPGDFRVLALASDIEKDFGNAGESMILLNAAIGALGEAGFLFMKRAEYYNAAGELSLALTDLRRAADLFPDKSNASAAAKAITGRLAAAHSTQASK